VFWGLLFGLLFFVPFLGMAVGAGLGALMGKVGQHAVDKQWDTNPAMIRQASHALKEILGSVVGL
jgi:uncharacterized membrane protein